MASVMVLESAGIRHQQPSARRDAVGFIVETLGKHFGQVPDSRVRSNWEWMAATPFVLCEPDDGEIGHPHLPFGAFLNEAHTLYPSFIAGKSRSHVYRATGD